MLTTVLLVLHVLIAVALIGLILIQHGRGADTGAAFGSGASGTIFGARGSASFLTRATAILAILFFSNSFLLSYLAARSDRPGSVMQRLAPQQAASRAIQQAGGESASDLPPLAGEGGAAGSVSSGSASPRDSRGASDLPEVGGKEPEGPRGPP